MAKILSYGSSSEIKNSSNNPVKNVWPWIQSQDKYVKISVVTLLLVIVATPFIAKNYLDVRQHADIQGLVASMNSYRSTQNSSLPKLSEDQALITAACFKAKDMADKNYFSHQDPQGNYIWPMLKSLGIGNEYMGEIIGKNTPDPATIVEYWKNSPPHNNLLLEPNYTRVGVGRAVAADGTVYWTSVFASGVPQPVTDWKCNDTPVPTVNPVLTPVYSEPEGSDPGDSGGAPVNPDIDGDGFSNEIEAYIGTDATIKCSASTVANPKTPNPNWPPDFNNDNIVNVLDTSLFSSIFGKRQGEEGFNPRFDLNKNGLINGQDVLALNKYFNKRCQ